MPQDAFTLRVAAEELNKLLLGGKVNKINQPSIEEIIIHVYANGKNLNLAISANAQCARVCPTRAEKQNPTVAPNFCMLLRKHLSGAVITKVENLGYERITKIVFDSRNDFKESVEKTLVCEIMGKYSNVILLEGNKILGTLRPSFGDITAQRTLLTGMPYTLPPAQEKLEITDLTRVIEAFCSFSGGAIDHFTAQTIKGISTPTAREIAIRFFGKTDAPSLDRNTAEEFANFIFNFLENPEIKPNVFECEGLKDFFATEYKSVSGKKIYFESLCDAEQFYFDRIESDRVFRQKSKALADKLKNYQKKLNKKLQLLTEKELSCGDAEINKIKGELLTAYQHSVPYGVESVELVNYYSETGEKIKITLDKDLSANRNAQNYYKKYNKQKKTLSAIIPQKEEVIAELNYVEDMFAVLYACEKASDFDFVTEELKAVGLIKEQAQKKKINKPSMPRMFEKGGFLIKVGRNNIQNDSVTFSASRDDVWLHTKDFHSAHVIIETFGKKVPDEILQVATEICAYYSKARNGDKVPVDYCLKKYVKKPPKAKPGGVIYTDFKTAYVTPNPHTEIEK